MPTLHSPRKAQSFLPVLFNEHEMVDDIFLEPAGEEEGQEGSESDSEGDLVPGARSLAMPGTSNQEPDSEDGIEEQRLCMVHSTLLIPRPDGTFKYNVDNEINSFISPRSSLYQCGGPVLRVQESRSWTMDVMLCWMERCSFCSEDFDEDETLEYRKEAAEWEERRPFDVEESPYHGMPFVHSKDIQFQLGMGGRVFTPVGLADAEAVLSSEVETREIDVLFTLSQRKLRFKCLACVIGRCVVCTEARAEAERQNSVLQKEQPSDPKPKQQQKRRQSKGKKVNSGSPEQGVGDGAQDDAEMEERFWINGDGEVHREYVRLGSPRGSTMEVSSNRSKGKRKMVDE